MGWWKKHAFAAAVAFAVIAPSFSFFGAAIPPPLVIYGFILYEGQPVEGVTVEAINEVSGERVSDVSEENGAFVVTLGNPPYEWSVGDKITLRATKDCLKGLLSFTVESDEPIKKNITLQLMLKADFTYKPSKPVAGEEVDFMDNSSGAMKWHWDFGDGNTSYDRNPKHVYAHAGNYNVTLTVSCNNFNISTTKQITVVGESGSEKEKKTPDFLISIAIFSLILAMFIRRRCIRSK